MIPVLTKRNVKKKKILRPLPFFIYINDQIENLQPNPKLFADDILFTIINDPNATDKQLCENLDNTKVLIYELQS